MLKPYTNWIERNLSLTGHAQVLLALFMATSLVLTVYSVLAVSKNEIQSVVQIAVFDAKGKLDSWGSGTIIDEQGDILTNHHVLQPALENEGYKVLVLLTVDAKHPPIPGVRVKLMGYNTSFDLGLLRITEINTKQGWVDFPKYLAETKLRAPYVKLDRFAEDEKVDLGQTLQILGYPGVGGSSITYTKGSVSGFENLDVEGERLPLYIKTDAKVNAGNSGGASFDVDENFVGVPTAVVGGAGNIGYVISLPVINFFLDKVLGPPIAVNQKTCPDVVNGYLGTDGVCYCNSGYEWSADQNTCLPAAPTATSTGTVIVPKVLNDDYCEKSVRKNSVFNPSSGNCECKDGFMSVNNECVARPVFVGTPKAKEDLADCAVVGDTRAKTYWLRGHPAIPSMTTKNKTCFATETEAKQLKYRKAK